MGEVPEDVKNLPVTADPDLLPEEKEFSITGAGDLSFLWFSASNPTQIKWFLSIEESEVSTVERDGEGRITGVTGKIPKGVVKLQASARKSNLDSDMVSYGPKKGASDD